MTRTSPHPKVQQFLEALVDGKARNGWVSGGGLKLYARAGYHMIEGKITKCLDLASVEAEHPGNGAFTLLIEWVEQTLLPAHGGVVFVESIINPRFAEWLQRRGYFPQNQGLGLSNMYKKIKKGGE